MAGVDAQAVKDRAMRTLKSFAPAQLATIGVLGVVAVVGALFFLRWVNTPTYQVLLAGLSPKDASAVTAQLSTDGVAYQLQGGGSTVLVPAAKLDAERLAIAAAGLPASQTDQGWAVFDKQGMTSSSFQQQVAYQRALEGTLGSTLTGINGVSTATVHLALPEKSVFTEQQQPARASVLLTTSKTLDAGAVDAVTRLVASSVPNLSPEDVSVSDAKGSLLTGGSSGGAQALQAQTALEDQLSARANTLLDTVLGPGHAVVRVSAELENATTQTDSEVYDTTKTAVTHESGTVETYAGAGGSTVGGVIATPTPLASVSPGAAAGNGYRKDDWSKDNGVSRTVTSAKAGPGGIKRLTVAVAVDSAAKNAPTATDVTSLVGNAVGLDPARGDTIAVTTPAFLRNDPVKAPATGGGLTGSASSVAPSILGGILLLLVALGFLRTIRRGTSTEMTAEQVSAALASAGGPDAIGAGEGSLARELTSGPSDGIVEIVDEHPDEVAHLLRGWLTDAGAAKAVGGGR
jgi:flagellar M-ring protein FliF